MMMCMKVSELVMDIYKYMLQLFSYKLPSNMPQLSAQIT